MTLTNLMARLNLVAYAFEWGTRSPMILKVGMDHQGLKVNRLYINDDLGLTLTYYSKVKFGQICLYQTNSQVSVYRTIGPLVFGNVLTLVSQLRWVFGYINNFRIVFCNFSINHKLYAT